MKKELILLKFNSIEEEIIEDLKRELKKIFKGIFEDIRVIKNSSEILKKFYNKDREQYNASMILDYVKNIEIREGYYRILAITYEDLYTERLKFVFGVAFMPSLLKTFKSSSAIISLKRLSEDFYNLSKNDNIFRIRTLKEAIHELGHTFGLTHCKKKCVMQFSNWIGDTDEKPDKFCDTCLQKIRKNYGIS